MWWPLSTRKGPLLQKVHTTILAPNSWTTKRRGHMKIVDRQYLQHLDKLRLREKEWIMSWLKKVNRGTIQINPLMLRTRLSRKCRFATSRLHLAAGMIQSAAMKHPRKSWKFRGKILGKLIICLKQACWNSTRKRQCRLQHTVKVAARRTCLTIWTLIILMCQRILILQMILVTVGHTVRRRAKSRTWWDCFRNKKVQTNL